MSYVSILNRNFDLIDRLNAPQFAELPREMQITWLEKSCLEASEAIATMTTNHPRLILHFVLGTALEISSKLGIQKKIITQIEWFNQAKRVIDCEKTLKVCAYLKRLAVKARLSDREFLKHCRHTNLSALYLLSDFDNQNLDDEVIEHIKHKFLLDKATAEAFIEYHARSGLVLDETIPRTQAKRIRPNPICGLEPYKKLGEKVKTLRIDSELSQEQLGKQVGLAVVSVFHLEKGDRRLDAVELWLLAKTFAQKSKEFQLLSECLERVFEGS